MGGRGGVTVDTIQEYFVTLGYWEHVSLTRMGAWCKIKPWNQEV